MTDLSQEPREERVAVAVTKREKRAVQFLALLDDTTESEIIRRYPLGNVLTIADERRAAVAAVTPLDKAS